MGLTRFPVETPTRGPGGRTNAYLVGGDGALLLDPPAVTEAIDDALDETAVDHVAVTHHHPDHVGAVAAYAEACDATVWARAGHEDEFVAATDTQPDRTFRDGTEIETGDGTVTIIDTPGHAPEHVAAEFEGAIAVGDLAVAEGSVVVGGPEADMRAYLTSLRRLAARDPDTLYPGHGPPIDRPRRTLERLISHRLERERRIRDAVREGARTLPEILDTAYDKDLDGVRDLARATVRCHLDKLAVEGEVDWDGEQARPR